MNVFNIYNAYNVDVSNVDIYNVDVLNVNVCNMYNVYTVNVYNADLDLNVHNFGICDVYNDCMCMMLRKMKAYTLDGLNAGVQKI